MFEFLKKKVEKKQENEDSPKKELPERINSKAEHAIAKYLADLKKSKDVDNFLEDVKRTRKLPLVYSLSFDSEKKIIFTTTHPIWVKKDTWIASKDAGRYQILIDFQKSGMYEGVRVLNIDKRANGHDHPCVLETRLCTGEDFGFDLANDYGSLDIYEIVSDVIAFLESPNDEAGYTRWGYFLRDARPCPKGYSFRKYLREHRESSQGIATFDGLHAIDGLHADYTFTATGVYSIRSGYSGYTETRRRDLEDLTRLMDLFFLNTNTTQHAVLGDIRNQGMRVVRFTFSLDNLVEGEQVHFILTWINNNRESQRYAIRADELMLPQPISTEVLEEMRGLDFAANVPCTTEHMQEAERFHQRIIESLSRHSMTIANVNPYLDQAQRLQEYQNQMLQQAQYNVAQQRWTTSWSNGTTAVTSLNDVTGVSIDVN